LKQVFQPWQIYPRLTDPDFERTQLGAKNTNKVEAHLYFGIISMALAIAGIITALVGMMQKRGRDRDVAVGAWLVIAAISTGLASGSWTSLMVHLPGFGYFTGPGRYGVLVQLGVAVAAAAGIRAMREWIVRMDPQQGRVSAWTTLVGSLALALATEGWMHWSGGMAGVLEFLFPVRRGWCDAVECGAIIGVISLLVVGLLALARHIVTALIIAAALLIWADVVSVARFAQFAEIQFESPIRHRELSPVRRALHSTAQPPRLLARNQNSMSLCDAATVPVYLGIGPREYFGGELQVPHEFHWQTSFTPATFRWLLWASVSHVLSLEAMTDSSLEPVWGGYDPLLHGLLGRPANEPLLLYEIKGARARSYWVAASDEQAALDPKSDSAIPTHAATDVQVNANDVLIHVQCDEPAVVVLSDLMYPGWEVWVNEQRSSPIEQSVFRAVRVPEGSHVIRWRYRPNSLMLGVAVMMLSFAGSGLYYFTSVATFGRACVQR
jgi:hypothetical protein